MTLLEDVLELSSKFREATVRVSWLAKLFLYPAFCKICCLAFFYYYRGYIEISIIKISSTIIIIFIWFLLLKAVVKIDWRRTSKQEADLSIASPFITNVGSLGIVSLPPPSTQAWVREQTPHGSLGHAPQGKLSGQELDQPYFLLVHQFLGKVGEPSRIRRSLKKKCMHSLNLKNRFIFRRNLLCFTSAINSMMLRCFVLEIFTYIPFL